MKQFLNKILLIAFLYFNTTTLFAHVGLDYPVGGETFFAGTIVTIEWTIVIPHDTENWDLYISYDAGENWTPLMLNIPVNELSFAWNVPYTADSEVRIRVVQDNIIDIDYSDVSENFTIDIHPQEGPVFETFAQDITIECDLENQAGAIEEWLEENGGAIALGTCGNLTWTNNFTGLSDSCGGTGTALVTFTVSDDCGLDNSTARLTVVDQTAPLIQEEADPSIVHCDGSGNLDALNNWLNNRGGAIASDVCSDVTWTDNFEGLSLECGMAGNAIVTFIASDACGNTSTTSAQFTILDVTPPDINITARDTVVQCDGSGNLADINHWLSRQGGASAIDGCSGISWTNSFSGLSDNCGNTGTAMVTFTASDACGNTSTTSAHITVVDAIAPFIVTQARDTLIDCDESTDPASIIQGWLDVHGYALAEDACGALTWSHDLAVVPDQCDTLITRTVHFIATDACGNGSTSEATLTVEGLTSVSRPNADNLRFHVFPNPADDVLIIAFEAGETLDLTIALFHVTGEQLWSHSGNEKLLSISLRDFTSGVYFLQVLTDRNTVITQRVMIR